MKISNKKTKKKGYRVLPKDNDSFFVRINSNEELRNLLIELKKLRVLGKNISYGTYLPDSYLVSDVVDSRCDYSEDISSVTVCFDNNEIRNKAFPNLYGINNIHVSLDTISDHNSGDVPKHEVSYGDAISQTIKLIEYVKK